MDLSRIPVKKGANSRFGGTKYNHLYGIIHGRLCSLKRNTGKVELYFKNRILKLLLYVCMIKTRGGKKKYEISVTTFTIITLYESQLLTSVIQANIQ